MYNHIVPECYVDTMLVHSFLKIEKNKKCNHKHGCFNVERELRSGGLKDNFGVGIIDNDKVEVKYLDEFFILDTICYQSGESESLVLWKHNNSKLHHYFIQICPAIEKWILQVCHESLIDLNDFGLPADLEGIKKITKSQRSSYDDRFVQLFNVMRQSEHLSIRKLQNWLNILVKDNYNVDINELKNG